MNSGRVLFITCIVIILTLVELLSRGKVILVVVELSHLSIVEKLIIRDIVRILIGFVHTIVCRGEYGIYLPISFLSER